MIDNGVDPNAIKLSGILREKLKKEVERNLSATELEV
jgi:hypothetical protein